MPSCLPDTARPTESGFDCADLVIWNMVVLAVEVLSGLAEALVHIYCPAVNGIEMALLDAEGNVVCLMTRRFLSP